MAVVCLWTWLAPVQPVAAQGPPPPPDSLQVSPEFEDYVPEVVFFPSAAPPPPSPFRQRVAEEKGLTLPDPKPRTALGRLYRPDGEGPFPAVVLLHGSYGIWEWDDLWAERLRSWGYVVLNVDSMTPRGLYRHNTGIGATEKGASRRYVGAFPRALDALGALAYLAAQPFVAPAAIAVLGMSEGGTTAMYTASPRDKSPAAGRFAASLALYPNCHEFERFDAPLLVLIGDADEWVSAAYCQAHLAKVEQGRELLFKVYPGAHHVFDFPGLDRQYVGRTLRHDPAAADDAVAEIRAFLERHLK
ncbi:MAG: dienelactone hydrolase family protein [Kiloniellales bacterium]